MPNPIGSTLGIVGGLILGQAAVSAYFEECTKVESYVADLSDLYLEHAAQRYLEEQENELLFRYDPHGGDELYQTIVRLIGGENDMERTK